ncbi:hypothetical protein FACS189450_09510 [Spirochaetia bacterium]|nr:hypothetical protein FACS189450_09510 [Spirochaetia bacterium]
MILHLFSDEKFIDYTITHFKRIAPAKNTFICIIPSSDYTLKYIKQIEDVELMIDSKKDISKLLAGIYQYDAVIFHSLFPRFFLKILYYVDPDKIKLVWIFFGGEFYDHPLIIQKYLGELSNNYYCFLKSNYKVIIMKMIKNIIKKSILFYDFTKFNIEKNIKKIAYISALEEENENIQKEWHINAQCLPMGYHYFSIEKTVGDLINDHVVGTNILIGNSANITNNHLEVFNILKDFSIGERKIIVPLSYGGNIKYQNYIVEQGKCLWGNNFISLLSFIEREKYNQYFLDCGVVIMNHYRQQAVGNIVTSLWLGVKLYMSERSPVYSFLKKKNIILYTIENDLKPDNPNVFVPLSPGEINNNRDILYKEYSFSNILNATRLIIEELSS